MLFHPGRILEVLNPKNKEIKAGDTETQAVVVMWDDNILTFSVLKKIVKNLKQGDVVLVDYRPISKTLAIPTGKIIKVLKGTKAERVWKIYKKELARKRKLVQKKSGKVVEVPQVSNYMG